MRLKRSPCCLCVYLCVRRSGKLLLVLASTVVLGSIHMGPMTISRLLGVEQFSSPLSVCLCLFLFV
jgi:hypothetical protein